MESCAHLVTKTGNHIPLIYIQKSILVVLDIRPLKIDTFQFQEPGMTRFGKFLDLVIKDQEVE